MELINAKTIVTNIPHVNWNYLACEYVMNIYRGCPHGCIYCYARSTYYDKTGDFDRVGAKKDALRIIRDDLRRKVKTGVIMVGGAADSYCPEEAEHKLTRNALELINAFGFGMCVITKSNLVIRDMDIMQDIQAHSPASVNFSITCAEDELSRKVEPFAPATSERFEAIARLAQHGITAGVLMDPVIPYITDTKENIQEMVKKAAHHGAAYMYLSLLVTMADVQRDYFYQEAGKFFPGIAATYQAKYKTYYRCRPPQRKKLWDTFVEACEKEGMVYDMRAANQRLRQGYSTI